MKLKKKGAAAGVAYDKSYITLSDLEAAEIEFTATSTEVDANWAVSDASVPPAMSKDTDAADATAQEKEHTIVPDANGFGQVTHTFSYTPGK